MEIENLKNISKQENYVRWIYDLIKPHIKGNVLEVGAGVGALTKLIEKQNNVYSIDIKAYDSYYSKTKPKIFDITENPSGLSKKFDTIICTNVLEHIKEDVGAIKNMNKLLKKEGSLILLVPAFKTIYGKIDKANNHYRRYTKKEILDKIELSNLKVKLVKYHNFIGLIGWIYQNKIIKKGKHRMVDLDRFNRFSPLFQKIESVIPPLVGLSIFLKCEKR